MTTLVFSIFVVHSKNQILKFPPRDFQWAVTVWHSNSIQNSSQMEISNQIKSVSNVSSCPGFSATFEASNFAWQQQAQLLFGSTSAHKWVLALKCSMVIDVFRHSVLCGKHLIAVNYLTIQKTRGISSNRPLSSLTFFLSMPSSTLTLWMIKATLCVVHLHASHSHSNPLIKGIFSPSNWRTM